jgi:hypothetical protein
MQGAKNLRVMFLINVSPPPGVKGYYMDASINYSVPPKDRL